jgi:hypothetical protein
MWLRNAWFNDPTAWNDDAFQLWTGRNLSSDAGWPPEAFCFGLGKEDIVDVTRVDYNEFAASVLEGTDYCCADYYNADSTHERGIVSGHELAHVYGEESHPYYCATNKWNTPAKDCNIMRNCKDPALRSFDFWPGTKREIVFRYHYAAEPITDSEGKPDCP